MPNLVGTSGEDDTGKGQGHSSQEGVPPTPGPENRYCPAYNGAPQMAGAETGKAGLEWRPSGAQ